MTYILPHKWVLEGWNFTTFFLIHFVKVTYLLLKLILKIFINFVYIGQIPKHFGACVRGCLKLSCLTCWYGFGFVL